MVAEIDDPADPRIDGFVRLTDMQQRLVREPADGIFVAEGQLAIERALASGYQPVCLLGPRRFVTAFEGVVDIPLYAADQSVLRAITGFHVHRGCLGLFARPPEVDPGSILRSARRILILENLVDHANVGAAVRSAAALDCDGVLLSPGCADPLYRRAIKVSMGATLVVPWSRFTDWLGGLETVRRAGVQIWALTPAADAEPLGATPEQGRVALMVGTEGAGLTAEALSLADRRLRIPMAPGVDSLNVAAAVAVAFFASRTGEASSG